jgi:hypothetical protein
MSYVSHVNYLDFTWHGNTDDSSIFLVEVRITKAQHISYSIVLWKS